MQISAFDIAQRFIGVREIAGEMSNPVILAMLRLDNDWPKDDSTPWCSAFVSYIAWLLRLPRSKSLAARSWLEVGTAVDTPEVGNDVVIFSRGTGSGHVGFYAGRSGLDDIFVLGGNQSDRVSVAAHPLGRLLGIRRLT